MEEEAALSTDGLASDATTKVARLRKLIPHKLDCQDPTKGIPRATRNHGTAVSDVQKGELQHHVGHASIVNDERALDVEAPEKGRRDVHHNCDTLRDVDRIATPRQLATPRRWL